MPLPKVYLISRKLDEDQINKIREAISLTPVDVVIVAQPQDVPLAKNFSEMVTGLHRPIAILGDFEAPLSVLNEGGTVETINV